MVLAVVIAPPVSAKEPLRGDQVMVLNQDLGTGEFGLYGCPKISWFGTIDFDPGEPGGEYGMALYPMPGRLTGDGAILHYEEGWKVWTGAFDVVNGVLLDCEPGEYVLSGTDRGVGSFVGGKFRSNGTVDEAHGDFSEWLGRKVHQNGILGPISLAGLEDVFGFNGDLRLN